MREIKFRAWDKDKNKFLYQDSENIKGKIDSLHFFFSNLFNDCDLMQYTGLKDKNGKEIYEKDIVLHDGYISVVSWGKIAHGFKLKTDTSINNKFGKIKYYSLPHSKKIEVIGNIYENPELLNNAL